MITQGHMRFFYQTFLLQAKLTHWFGRSVNKTCSTNADRELWLS